MQQLTVLGNLGADAQVREDNGRKFVTFKVADTTKFTNQKGETKETTTWVSCVLSGDGGNLLPYLKKGVKVLVVGRPGYKVYSSEKARAMLAGVDLHVISVELAGGSSDDVPRQLVNPDTSELVNVSKYYWVPNLKSCTLFGVHGGAYLVDKKGFVTPQTEPSEKANNESTTEENS